MAEGLFTPLCVEMLADGFPVRFQASGTSMHPAICDGDWVTVEPVQAVSLRPGHVLLYRSLRGLTAHRLIFIESSAGIHRRLVIRGDTPGALAEHVELKKVLGRVSAVERGRMGGHPDSARLRLSSTRWRRASGMMAFVRGLGACFLSLGALAKTPRQGA
jgi:hypothetical protein